LQRIDRTQFRDDFGCGDQFRQQSALACEILPDLISFSSPDEERSQILPNLKSLTAAA
jgi:hypothetical protein